MPSKSGKVPLPGDGVWHPDYKNGVVQFIDWERKTIIVEWYNNGEQIELDIDNFWDNWMERLNQWVLY